MKKISMYFTQAVLGFALGANLAKGQELHGTIQTFDVVLLLIGLTVCIWQYTRSVESRVKTY
jgi:hypothetical protein